MCYNTHESYGGIAQLVRALASHARGRRFEPYCLYHSGDCEKVAKQNEGGFTLLRFALQYVRVAFVV